MGQEYNEKMFPIHTSSSILIGVLVGATSLWPCMVFCGSFTENNANGNEHSAK
jgi:integral membrane sensor domain MASE1